jgi:hypothetical protein
MQYFLAFFINTLFFSLSLSFLLLIISTCYLRVVFSVFVNLSSTLYSFKLSFQVSTLAFFIISIYLSSGSSTKSILLLDLLVDSPTLSRVTTSLPLCYLFFFPRGILTSFVGSQSNSTQNRKNSQVFFSFLQSSMMSNLINPE